MGNCNFKKDTEEDTAQEVLSKETFNMLYPIGKGGFGRVWKVEFRRSRQQFAMKEMLKCRVVAKRSINSVLNERKLLVTLKHPLLVNIQYAFQDRDNLYLVMDLMTGGDLRYHLCHVRVFTEIQTRFFVGCLVDALEYLHSNKVIHRDIKPENLVLDNKGYLHLTDFGIARLYTDDNAQDTSGTPGYMAPEVICKQNHTYTVDYFAIGVLVFEFMLGRRPYQGRNRKEIRDQIIAKQVQLRRQDIPTDWSIEAADFTNKLLQRKAQNRLGFNGIHELKNHSWLRSFPWEQLRGQTLKPPYVPGPGDNFDTRHLNDWKDLEMVNKAAETIPDATLQSMFAGYLYDPASKTMASDPTCPKP